MTGAASHEAAPRLAAVRQLGNDAEQTAIAQVLAANNDRESIMPYIEVFKTLIRCTPVQW